MEIEEIVAEFLAEFNAYNEATGTKVKDNPIVLIRLINSQDINVLSGATANERARLIVDCYHNNTKDLNTFTRQVRNKMRQFEWQDGIELARLVNESSIPEPNNKVFRKALEYRLEYTQKTV